MTLFRHDTNASAIDLSFLGGTPPPSNPRTPLFLPTPKVRVSALKCVAAILPLLDETTVVSAVLPTLRRVRDQDHTPAVVMCSLGCYELIAKRLLPSALARHLLPGYARTAHVRAELEGKRGGCDFCSSRAGRPSLFLVALATRTPLRCACVFAVFAPSLPG